MNSEELRFITDLSVLLSYGRPLIGSLKSIASDCRDPRFAPAYEAMVKCTANGGDFTTVLGDYPALISRTSAALLKAARRSNCLVGVLPKLALLVQAKVEGELDPRGRFFETWALFVESGFTVEESLRELSTDFSRGPLGEVAEGLRASSAKGKSLADGAKGFPEVFGASATDLLEYGESRDLAAALRAINELI
jgi:type II secretory pathway component PulF